MIAITALRLPDKPQRCTTDALHRLDDGRHVAQKKWNGWRCVIVWQKPTLQILSRYKTRTIPISKSAKQAITAMCLRAKTKGLVLDAEYMGMRSGARRESVVLLDVLYLEGVWQGSKPWNERDAMLQSLPVSAPIQLVENFYTDFAETYAHQQQDSESEGLVIKRLKSKLIGGIDGCKRNPHWFKVRYREDQV